MSVLNGTAMAWYIGGVKVANLLSNGFSIDRPTREVSNKDSGDFTSKQPTRASWGGSGSAHFDFAAGYGFSNLYTAIKNKTRLLVMSSTEATTEKLYEGYAYLTQLQADFPDQDNSSYSFNLDGDGDLNEKSNT